MSEKLIKVLNNYWRSGIVGALVVLDSLVLFLCLMDIFRFTLKGLSLWDALRATIDVAPHDRALALLILSVFLFFVVGIPTATSFIGSFWPSERWPGVLAATGKSVIILHVSLSLVIACFTALAIMMEVLSGWSSVLQEGRNYGLEYSFVSFWLFIVLFWKFISIAYLSPILKKLLWRMGGERHVPGSMSKIAQETIKEVLTEHGKGE